MKLRPFYSNPTFVTIQDQRINLNQKPKTTKAQSALVPSSLKSRAASVVFLRFRATESPVFIEALLDQGGPRIIVGSILLGIHGIH